MEDRKLCCQVRKVEPLQRALLGLTAWVSGLRREQSNYRSDIPKIEAESNGRLKICPLADWSEKKVWNYIRENNVPYNRLHDQLYPSICCAPCTRSVNPGEDSRSGRWWWESADSKECGLHAAK